MGGSARRGADPHCFETPALQISVVIHCVPGELQMEIQSRTERNFWVRTLIAIVPDVLIGALIGLVTSNNVIASIVVTVIALQLFYLLLLVKDVTWGWVVFRLSGDRDQLRRAAFAFLRKNRFPEPDDYISDVGSYFEQIMKNSQLPCETRIKAAIELTSASCMARLRGKMRVLMAWEDAIEKYKKTFPEKSWDADMTR